VLPPPPPPFGGHPPPPLGGYPPPPPGWYPGAPPPRPKRRTWLIVVSIVVPVLLLIGVGLVMARGTDPAAAKDRDAANTALLTNSDLGGTFHETAHRSFARSRAGIRVEDAIAECGAADNVFEKDGQAVVDSILQSQNGVSAQVIAEEVLIVGSPPSATPVLDAIVGTLRSCVRAGLAKSQSTVGIQLQLSPSPAPDIGDRAAAFAGSAGFGGGSAAIGILIVQQGRAIAFLMAFDSTGNLQGARLESSMHTLLGRLAPTFGP